MRQSLNHKGKTSQRMSLPLDYHLNLAYTFFFSFENKPLDTWYDAIQNVHTHKKNCNSVHNILSCSCKNEGLIH